MSLILEHLEYLMLRYDCVTLPGIGALMARYQSARFDRRNPLVLLPPSRQLVFNGQLDESDGVLERSVSRRCGVSFEMARRMVEEDAENLRAQLFHFGTLPLGRLGQLEVTDYDTVIFTPRKSESWDYRYYGLRPLYLKSAESVVAADREEAEMEASPAAGISGYGEESRVSAVTVEPWTSSENEEEEGRGSVMRRVIGVAASLAVLITLALFLLNPIKVSNEPVKASMGKVETVEAAPSESEGIINTTVEIPTETPAASNGTDVASAGIAVTSTGTADTQSVGAAESDNGNIKSATGNTSAVTTPATATNTSAATASTPERVAAKPAAAAGNGVRFNESDPYCVVVASFPDASQADRYIAENPRRTMGVIHQDGKYRVYAATGLTYRQAAEQKSLSGKEGAWICHR